MVNLRLARLQDPGFKIRDRDLRQFEAPTRKITQNRDEKYRAKIFQDHFFQGAILYPS